jgi:hypothetical protein
MSDINTLPNGETVSFFTICYEGDWERILKENRLETIIARCNVNFFEKVLVINNVKNRELVEQYAKEAVDKKILDAYYFSEDHSEAVLSAFSITRKSFHLDFYDGYWYSIAPLTAIYFCKGKYLLFFTGDCMMEERSNPRWIQESVELMQQDNTILVANPITEGLLGECKNGAIKEDDKYYYTIGFSDQCFLVEKSRFYGNIYNDYHYFTEHYPVYGGELFEKRVNSYMSNNLFFRIMRKDAFYTHEKLLNKDLEGLHIKPSFKKKAKMMAATCSRKIRKVINRRILGHTRYRDKKSVTRIHI